VHNGWTVIYAPIEALKSVLRAVSDPRSSADSNAYLDNVATLRLSVSASESPSLVEDQSKCAS
jgi:hypothetical protein